MLALFIPLLFRCIIEHGAILTVYGGSAEPYTAVRIARIRLLNTLTGREVWLRQTRVFVRSADGMWQLVAGQGTLMYEGPILDTALHARYAGNYVIAPGRTLTIRWEEGSLLARFPNGATTQIFLASPTQEAVRTIGAGSLHFTLSSDRLPITATQVRGEVEVWRARRETPKSLNWLPHSKKS